MDVKTTRHISTDLDEINKRIAQVLKDPSDALSQAQIDVDSMSRPEMKEFAEQGERITVLKHIQDDTYLGYCEGVIGQFNAENVHFVELDPRVLESLDADLEFALEQSYNSDGRYRYSANSNDMESYGTRTSNDYQGRTSNDNQHQLMSDNEVHYTHPRNSLQSNSCTSEQYSSSVHEKPWPTRSSLESLVTTSSASASASAGAPNTRTKVGYERKQPNLPNNGIPHPDNHDFNHTNQTNVISSTNKPKAPMREQSEHFDTSAFNDDYSNESDEDAGQSSSAQKKQQDSKYAKQQTLSPVALDPNVSPFKNLTGSKTVDVKSDGKRSNFESDFGDEEDEFHDGDDEGEIGDDSGISSRNSYKTDSSTPTNASIDEYGFIIDPKRSRSGFDSISSKSDMSSKSIKAYREREVKWLSIVGKLDAGTVKKDAKMKKLVRSGIPASVRARVWQYLAGTDEYKKKGLYQSLLKKPRTDIYDVIERDIARSYPDHTQFKDENGQGQRDLRDILKAYSQYNPQLGYCQGMGRLAGCMLMHMPVEDAFWLVVATIDRYMNGYFTPALPQLRIDAYIIGQLLKDHQPKLAQHLKNNGVEPNIFITQWFLTAFTMTLPWSAVLRVWDVFYFEGVKVFYRISLAIMEICKDHLLYSCPTNSELLEFLLHIPHEYLGADTLLEVAFRIKLSKTDIKRYAKKASTGSDETTTGLPFEHGLKNLQVGTSSFSSSHSLGNLRDKMKRKNSSVNIKESGSNTTIHDMA
ncbi:hypothetical protein DFQ28_005993 [Apophysomyces sp. BC1034]|nr:hypothetical protein DFQ30_008051 [Apophysomyces sp. BC1015]KAG0175594.1 hypothetical protein DFQ29_007081 [Apophysomyces sp. BC1021]KAG0187664.1 hypothetical protein DFQ28_005993 [Apophysomyces sp. BC1034]